MSCSSRRSRVALPAGRRAALLGTRRQFLSGLAASAVGAGCSGSRGSGPPEWAEPAELSAGPFRKASTDQVLLGSTDIRISRLAMGSGTHGYDGASDQTRLGLDAFASLLVQSYDRGISFWETADQYGAHAHLKQALAAVGRQNIVVLTKTHAETESEARADLVRFMGELGTDYIDIVLLHNKQSGSWTDECAGAMSYLADAKQQGMIRAHGVSCHTLAALRLAARTDWVDVDLARVNPAGLHMDAGPATVIEVLKEMKAAGKGVLGMKIFGQGDLTGRLDEALRHAVALDCLDGFTIGFRSSGELDEVQQKIAGM